MWNDYKLFCHVNGLSEGNFKSLEMWYILNYERIVGGK